MFEVEFYKIERSGDTHLIGFSTTLSRVPQLHEYVTYSDLTFHVRKVTTRISTGKERFRLELMEVET